MDKLPGGLWPVMLTPFKDDGSIDYDGLKALTDFYRDAGANGLFANCLSSEMFDLTSKERISITQTVVNQCAGKIPVVATGTFCEETSVNADFIKKIFDTGTHAVIISTSQIINPQDGDDILKLKLEELMKATEGIPLGIYECPVPFKKLISPQLIKWLAESNRFLYHKDTSCNLDEIITKLEMIDGSNLSLYNANTPTALESMQSGARGISPISANFYPEFYSYLYKNYMNEDKARKLSNMLTIMENVTDRYYPWSAKWFLQHRGLRIDTTCRVDVNKIVYEDQVKLNSLYEIFRNVAESNGIPILELN
ncbi:dihydrodipicolinate synthase family protein [Bacteroidota bacterium]